MAISKRLRHRTKNALKSRNKRAQRRLRHEQLEERVLLVAVGALEPGIPDYVRAAFTQAYESSTNWGERNCVYLDSCNNNAENIVHRWGQGFIQDFRGGRFGGGAIMMAETSRAAMAETSRAAYAIWGKHWELYSRQPTMQATDPPTLGRDWLGYPTSDHRNPTAEEAQQIDWYFGNPPPSDLTTGSVIYFQGGHITFRVGDDFAWWGPNSPNAIPVTVGQRAVGVPEWVTAKFQEAYNRELVDLGDWNSTFLGSPSSLVEQRDGGWVQNFQGGRHGDGAIMLRASSDSGTAYAVWGDHWELYRQNPIPGARPETSGLSLLGYPLTDHRIPSSQDAAGLVWTNFRAPPTDLNDASYVKFERGYITWRRDIPAGISESPRAWWSNGYIGEPEPGVPTHVTARFQAAYDRLIPDFNERNAVYLGTPVNAVHRWGDGWIQDFRYGRHGDGAVMLLEGTNIAYAVWGKHWELYSQQPTMQGTDPQTLGRDWLGYPISDHRHLEPNEVDGVDWYENGSPPASKQDGPVVDFQRGHISWKVGTAHAWWTKSYTAGELSPGIDQSVSSKFQAAYNRFLDDLGEVNSVFLGSPVRPVEPWGDGWIQRFRGGRHGDGAITLKSGATKAFAIWGHHWDLYKQELMQGTDPRTSGREWLGFPISDHKWLNQEELADHSWYDDGLPPVRREDGPVVSFELGEITWKAETPYAWWNRNAIIVLAWGKDVPVRVVRKVDDFGYVYYPIDPDENARMLGSQTDELFREEVSDRVRRIFQDSMIRNVSVTDRDTPNASVVYFADPIDNELLGKAYTGVDQCNTVWSGEAVVFIHSSDAELVAETVAHEVGHLLGLRHVDPSEEDDPDDLSVMDYDINAEDREQFINAVSEIFDPGDSDTHNPYYHLKRYVDRVAPAIIENTIQKGSYDVPERCYRRDQTRLVFDESDRMLYDVHIFETIGEITQTLAHFEEIKITNLTSLEFSVADGAALQLVAASEFGGALDTVLTTGNPYQADTLLIRPGSGESNVFVQSHSISNQGYETIADGSATSVPIDPGPDFVIQETFDNSDNLTLSGSSRLEVGRLLLADEEWQTGSVWFNNIVARDSFTTEFAFEIDRQGSNGWGDGFTFAVLDASQNGNSALGTSGGGLGYEGLSGFAIEFDTYSNLEHDDPSFVHVGLNVSGSVNSIAESGPLPFDIRDGGSITAEILVESQDVRVFLTRIDGERVLVLSATLPQSSVPELKRVGFTGGTAFASQRVRIDNFQLELPPANASIQFVVDAVIYPNHFTQSSGQASDSAVSAFRDEVEATLDAFLNQLRVASNGILDGSSSILINDRVLTRDDYDQSDFGSGNEWLFLHGGTIDAMLAEDFSTPDAAYAFVMWGDDPSVSTANFYHGNNFISMAGAWQGAAIHEFMHLLDDEFHQAGEPGMVHADRLGDPSTNPCVTTAETRPNGELNWEGVPLIQNILSHHESCDGRLLDYRLLKDRFGTFVGSGPERILNPLNSTDDETPPTIIELNQSQERNGLTVQGSSNPTVFQFEMMGRGAADHSLVFSPDPGKSLQLELRDANGTVLSRGLTGGHALSLAGYGPGDYTVHVAGTGTDVITYSLDFRGQFTAGEPALATVDIDGDGRFNTVADYRLVSLVRNGQSASIIDGLRGPNATRSGVEIINLVRNLQDALDVDGDGRINTVADRRLLSLVRNGQSAATIEQFRSPNSLRDGDAIVARATELLMKSTVASGEAPEGESTIEPVHTVHANTAVNISASPEGEDGSPRQVVQLSGPSNVAAGTNFNVKVNYEELNPIPESPADSIAIRIYFDRTKLTVAPASSSQTQDRVFDGLGLNAITDETPATDDGNPDTNAFYFISWANDNGIFSDETRPVELVDLQLTASADTVINLFVVSDDSDVDYMQEVEGTPLEISVDSVITVDVAPASVQEDGATNLEYSFTRMGDLSETLTVNFGVSGTAEFNTDYSQSGAATFSATVGTVTFAAGSSMSTVIIDPIADTVVEDDETVILTITAGNSYVSGDPNAATGTILNDDADQPTNPTLSITATDAIKNEGDTGSTPFTFTVTRSGDLSGETSVDYTITGSGANMADAADFGGTLPGGTINFEANEASQVITVNVSGDTVIEADEGFTVTLRDPSGSATITTDTAMGVIQNDDSTTLAIAATDAIKNEGDTGSTPFTFTVTRSGDLSSATSVEFGVTGSGDNVADAADFGGTLPEGTINFAANEATQVITVDVSGDTVVEEDESFTVTLRNPSAPATITTAAAMGLIQNDDFTTLAIAATDAIKNEGDTGSTPFTFTVTRSGDLSSATSVEFDVTGSGANMADAADFGGTLPVGTINFAATEATQVITVDVSGDTVVEDDESFTVTLRDPSAPATITTDTAMGVIQNDDSTTLAIAATDAIKNEGDTGSTPFTFTVTRSGDLSSATSVEFRVTGSGANMADAADFGGTLPMGTINFAANEATQVITVDVSGDTVVEEDESFMVTLRSPSAPATISMPTATGTILNDDATLPPTLSITATDAEKNEGNTGTTPFTFTVLRTGDTTGTTTVNYTVSGSGTNPAVANDFTGNAFPNGIVIFFANETSKEITIPVNGDTTIEPDEGFTVRLTNPFGGTIITETASGTILNDDDAVREAGFTVTETDGSTIVSESGTTDSFHIVLNAPPLSNVVLDISGSDPTEVTFSPTSLVFTPTNWFVPQSITVTGVDDDEFDGDQQSTITVSVDAANSDDAFDALPDQTVIVTTLDDEVGGVGASISGFVFADVNNNSIRDASENGIVNVEVRLSGPVSRTTTTGPDGSYRFTSLPAGSYSVSETQPLAFLDGIDTPGDGLNGTAGNDVFSNINLSGQMNLQEYNFGERGLQARFISLNQFLARPSPSRVDGLVFPANGEGESSAVAFRAGGSGLVTLSAEGEATLQLFDSSLTPLARSTDGALTSELEAGKGYVLYVATVGASASLTVDASTVSLLTGAVPLHNPMLTTDVDLDGSTTPLDALLIINHLNAPAAGLAYPTFMDVNGDQMVTPIDVLQVINLLNLVVVDEVHAEGEGSPPSDVLDTATSMQHVVTFPNGLSRAASSEAQNDGERQAGLSDDRAFAVGASSLTSDDPRQRMFSAASDSEPSDDDDLEAAISLIAEEVGEFWQQ